MWRHAPCCPKEPEGQLEVTLCSHLFHQAGLEPEVPSRRGHALDTVTTDRAAGAGSTSRADRALPGGTRLTDSPLPSTSTPLYFRYIRYQNRQFGIPLVIRGTH